MNKQNYLVKAWLTAKSGTGTSQKMRQVMALSADEFEAYDMAEERLEREFGDMYDVAFNVIPIGQATLNDVRGGELYKMEDAT